MKLSEELQQLKNEFTNKGIHEFPEEKTGVMDGIKKEGIVNKAPKVGDKVPDFELPDIDGKMVSLSDLLKKGPVVISFYRGDWCVFCNLELRALQRALSKFKKYNATLVGISPDKLEYAKVSKDKHSLDYTLLSDAYGSTAAKYGLLFDVPQELFDTYDAFGVEVRKHTDSEGLPIPATYVVRSDGQIVYAFVDEDYTKRADPAEIVATLMELESA